MFQGMLFNYLGSIFIALGYIGLVMLFYVINEFHTIKKALATVGRTALSNYFLQTIICTLFFYGHGLGFFGWLSRKEQFVFVVGVWIVQLIVSIFWLKLFRFGPFEWIWRCLTYRKLQPMMRGSEKKEYFISNIFFAPTLRFYSR